MYKPTPLFRLGQVPNVPHCYIQCARYDAGKGWLYFVENRYNSYASGWISEDDLIQESKLNQR